MMMMMSLLFDTMRVEIGSMDDDVVVVFVVSAEAAATTPNINHHNKETILTNLIAIIAVDYFVIIDRSMTTSLTVS